MKAQVFEIDLELGGSKKGLRITGNSGEKFIFSSGEVLNYAHGFRILGEIQIPPEFVVAILCLGEIQTKVKKYFQDALESFERQKNQKLQKPRKMRIATELARLRPGKGMCRLS